MATKLMEASMALLQATPEQQMNIVVLNKALFYLDLAALRDMGNTVTGERYFALPMGPVVNKYEKRLVRNLERAGWAEQLEEGMAKPVRVRQQIEFDLLSKAQIRLAREVAKFANDFTSTRISKYAHDNPGWIAAYKHAAPGKGAPEIDLHLAMQQVLDEDPWLDEALDGDTKRVLENARSSRLHDW